MNKTRLELYYEIEENMEENNYIKFNKEVDFLPIMGKDRKIFATYKSDESDEYDYFEDRIPEVLDMGFSGITTDFEKLIFMCQEYPIEIKIEELELFLNKIKEEINDYKKI